MVKRQTCVVHMTAQITSDLWMLGTKKPNLSSSEFISSIELSLSIYIDISKFTHISSIFLFRIIYIKSLWRSSYRVVTGTKTNGTSPPAGRDVQVTRCRWRKDVDQLLRWFLLKSVGVRWSRYIYMCVCVIRCIYISYNIYKEIR